MTTGTTTAGAPSVGPLYVKKTWSGSDDPRNKTKFNAYNMRLESYLRTLTVIVNKTSGTYKRSVYTWAPLHRGYPTFDNNDKLALLGKMSDKIRGHSFNAAVSAAELPEALRMVSNSLRAFFALQQAVRRRDPVGVARTLASLIGQRKDITTPPSSRRWTRSLKSGDVGSTWLAIQYGWLPLLSDIKAGMDSIEAMTKGPRSLTYRASHQRKASWDDSTSNLRTIPTNGRRQGTLEVCLTEPLSISRSLGLDDPLSVLWEKIPFSFVADWFIPIGNYLEELLFFSRLSTKYAHYTEYYESRGRDGLDLWNLGAYERVSDPGFIRTHRVTLLRDPNYSVVLPRPSIKSMDQAWSGPHIRNALALVVAIGGGRVKPGVTPFHVPLSRS